MTPSRPLSPQIAGQRSTLRFSTPLRIGVVAVLAMAAIVLGSVLVPRDGGTAPIAGGSATASAAAEPDTPSPEPRPTFSPAPTLLATPQLTPEPIAEWTGLTWLDPVTPPFVVYLSDLLPWGGGYVGVGSVGADYTTSQAAFLTSPDGLHWSIADQFDPGAHRHPWRLVSFGDELFAFSGGDAEFTDEGMVIAELPLIWRSRDGTTWTPVESAAWNSVWSDAWLIDVESGPDGIIAIGNHRTGDYSQLSVDPVVLRSMNGVDWDEGEITGGTEQSVVTDIIGFAGGFALLGGDETGTVSGVGMPRAWFSDDGVTWLPAPVEGASDADNHFEHDRFGAQAASDGLFARTQMLCAGCSEPSLDWVSSDGRAWHRASGIEVPGGWMASDGTRIVSFGSGVREAPVHPGGDVDVDEASFSFTHAWTSNDGVTWTELTLSHPMTDLIDQFWVVPDGVIYAGEQSFWFGTAIER